jgi:hypothetical protein
MRRITGGKKLREVALNSDVQITRLRTQLRYDTAGRSNPKSLWSELIRLTPSPSMGEGWGERSTAVQLMSSDRRDLV